MTAAGVATVRCRSCYELHPVQGGRTPLQELAAPLQALAGHHRFYNLLDREGFKYVEEVTATPDRCLLELRNAGPKLITAVRKVIEDLRHEARGTAADVVGLDLAARVTQPALLPEITGALQALAAWAQAERGARTLGDVLTLADGITYLPPDVTRAWELMTGTRLRFLADPPDEEDLPYLAEDLLQQIDQRRRLILIARTFGPDGRTYRSLAAELGVTPGRARQLEESARHQLGQAVAGDRYAPLRWRALSAAASATGTPDPLPGSPPWMGGLLAWLAQQVQEAESRPS